MAALTTQTVTQAGITLSFAAVAASDTFVNTGQEVIYVKNGGGSPTTVTVTSGGQTYHGASYGNQAVTVNNASEKIFLPYPPEVTNSTSTGLTTVTCSPTTSVTIAIVQYQKA